MKRKLMKKQLTKFLTGSLLTLAACFIISTPVKASVKNFKTTQTSLKATADVTGDGKGDSIKIKYGHSSYDSISKFAIYINGKKVHTQKFTEPNDVFYLSATYAKMSNSKEFIQVIGYGPNDIKEFNTVYQFDAKKNVLNPVLDLNNNFGSADKITAADSKAITVLHQAQPSETGWLSWTYQYVYSKNKLKLINPTSSDVKSLIGNATSDNNKYSKLFKKNQFVAAKKLSFYNGNKLSYTVTKGKTVTLKKITCSDNKMYLQFQYGKKTGWLSVYRTKYDFDNPYFKDVTRRLAG